VLNEDVIGSSINRLFKNGDGTSLFIIDPQNSNITTLTNQQFEIISPCSIYRNILKPFDYETGILYSSITLQGKDKTAERRTFNFG